MSTRREMIAQGERMAHECLYGPGSRLDMDPDDYRDALVDAIANLRHWSASVGIDWATWGDAITSAENHYRAENRQPLDAESVL